jgi:predicted ATPase/DNA-binding CsgD family transcriptional regulator
MPQAAASARLPVPPAPLVGRQREIGTVCSLLLDAKVRLLTITGPGGVGKTRLAVEVASALVERDPHDVAFVDLAPLRDPELVPATIANALGVDESGQRLPIDALAASLGDRRFLLLLDNAEQVRSSGAWLAGLLQRCPHLTALVTSRALLRVYGEHTFPLPPLELPPPTAPATVELLSAYPAVELFVTRARAALPGFRLDDDNAAAVAAICHRLDGLPLALELAAARVPLLAPKTLLAHLARSLAVAAGGPVDLPVRLRSLRDAVGWSYDLLAPGDRLLLRRLAVFAGGWTLAAAEAIAGGADVLEGLASLAGQSLVRRVSPEGAEEPRFGMLETVREIALERLRGAGEEAASRDAHAGWCLALAEAAETGLRGAEQQPWRDRLEAELENVRAAMTWLLGEGRDAGAALRLAGALWYFWYWRGLLSEGRRWLSAARRAAGDEGAPGARALLGEGSLAHRQGDYEVALPRLEESVARWRALGDAHWLAEALHLLGHVHFDRRDYEAARRTFEASLATYDAPGDSLVGLPLVNDLGLVAYHQGRFAEAGEIFADCLPRFRRQGLKDRVADTLLRLGDLARLAGRVDDAARLYEESRGLWLELHGEPGIASSLHKLGLVERSRGDVSGAAALLAESLGRQRDLGNRQGIAECLAGLAGVSLDAGRTDAAARLLAACSAVLDEVGAPLAPADAAEADRDRALARERLEERAWESASREGRSLALDEAVAMGMAVADEPAPAVRPGGRGQVLSAREREVAVLVARGLTNREIADALHIAQKTAANHVDHIMTKLDLRSRTQVAVWAVREGL